MSIMILTNAIVKHVNNVYIMYLFIFFGQKMSSRNIGLAHSIFKFSFTHQCDESAHIKATISPTIPTSENSGMSNHFIFTFFFMDIYVTMQVIKHSIQNTITGDMLLGLSVLVSSSISVDDRHKLVVSKWFCR